ncbi:MAG: hypothetical protein R2867_02010 [Caldilineaceae bacterium]
MLEQTAGTTGRFYSLHILLGERHGGQLVLNEAAVTYFDDRIRVDAVTVESDGDVTVEMLTKSPSDPLAISSLLIRQTYRLQGNQLLVVAATPLENSGTSAVCADTYPTRLSQNGRAYVLPEPPLSSRVRTTPSRQGRQIGSAQPCQGPESWAYLRMSARKTTRLIYVRTIQRK